MGCSQVFVADAFSSEGQKITITQSIPNVLVVGRPTGGTVEYKYEIQPNQLVAIEAEGLHEGGPLIFTGPPAPIGQPIATYRRDPYSVRIIPNDVPGNPDLLSLCTHSETPSAKRLVCLHHRSVDNVAIAVVVHDDVEGVVTTYFGQRPVQ